MHELSIVEALIGLAARYVPPGGRPTRVVVEVGPFQGIDDSAMRWAWEVQRVDSAFAAAQLEIIHLPWRLECRSCGRAWEAAALDEPCTCGSLGVPQGGDELRLLSLEVESPDESPSDTAPSDTASSATLTGL